MVQGEEAWFEAQKHCLDDTTGAPQFSLASWGSPADSGGSTVDGARGLRARAGCESHRSERESGVVSSRVEMPCELGTL